MTSSEAVFAKLFAKRPQIIKPGLERVRAGLKQLLEQGVLAPSPRTVLVGGTNGKGTTAGFLSQLLTGAGERAALFTSPHLVRFSERMRVAGSTIDDEAAVEGLRRLQGALPSSIYEPMSFFEVNTLPALLLFRERGATTDILEVGLGGRLDSTNVLDPIVSVIASIGLDHQALLGSTPAAIAVEKAGIMRAGRPVLWGGDGAGAPDAVQVIRTEAQRLGAPLWEEGGAFGVNGDGIFVHPPAGARHVLPLPRRLVGAPAFLKSNAAKAVAAFVALETQSGASEAAAVGAVQRGIDALDADRVPTPPSLRARFERIVGPDGHAYLLDVGHNVDGVRALASGLRETGLLPPDSRLPGLVSILADKDCDDILDILREVLDPIALFATASERSWTPARLASRHRDLPFYAGFAAARADPRVLAASRGPIVVCGSVLALGAVCQDLGVAID